MDPLDKYIDKKKPLGAIGSPSDSFEAVVDILGVSSETKLLGELVWFQVPEGDYKVISLGQITDIVTENKWHEEPSFKAVIKRHGSLPHLSGQADNRIAKLTIQSSFKDIENKIVPAKLANSPSTGEKVLRVSNELLSYILKDITAGANLEYLGKAYETDIKIPFWFKHFGNTKAGGAGDAYHLGIFGKTGSGKTTTAAKILAGYAKNSKDMSFLVLDPQAQFSTDQELLPDGKSFKSTVQNAGLKYHAVSIPENVHLPNNSMLFAELLTSKGFIRKAFNITSEDKQALMAESISEYLDIQIEQGFNLAICDPGDLFKKMLTRFIAKKYKSETKCSRYISNVYSQSTRIDQIVARIQDTLEEFDSGTCSSFNLFNEVIQIFRAKDGKISLERLVNNIVKEKGSIYIVNLLSAGSYSSNSDNIQALLIKLICQEVIKQGEQLYTQGRRSNCLITIDEAHRFTNASSSDVRIRELNKEIVDAVRTTRKYGVGYMFITQTIESIDDEILQQMRIFAFGYGLTMGKEFGKIKQIINDDSSAKFYRSFIDPSSNGKFPFMFHGPISPLSFTGSPLFIDMK